MSVMLTDVVKTFSGDGRSSIVEWIKKVELVAKLQKVEDMASFIPLFLEGDAFAIYDQLPENSKEKYGDVKSALVRAFSMTPFQAFESFKKRHLKPQELPDAFLAELRRLASLFEVDNEAILACQFVSGMPPDVGAQLKALRQGSLNVHKLLECAKLILQNRPVEADDGAIFPPTAAAGKSVRPPGGRDSGTGTGKRCNGCGRLGHVQKDCQVKCFQCYQRGHIKRNCPHAPPPSANFGSEVNSENDQGEASPSVDLGVSPFPMGYRQ